MTTHTDTYPAPSPAAVVTVPHRRWKRSFVALGLVTLLAFGAGVGSAALFDDGSSSVARPPTAAATVPSTADTEALWSYLAQLPAAERDEVLGAFIPDPTGALAVIGAARVTPGGG